MQGKIRIYHTKYDIASYACKLLTYSARANTFDSDSTPLGIDTCASATMSGIRSDFVGELEPVTATTLQGVGGNLPVVGKGTMIFNFVDDEGETQQLQVRDAFYVPRLKMRLLSPQQWSKQGPTDRFGKPERGINTTGTATTLYFGKRRKTVTHDKNNNLPLLHSAPGFQEFAHFVTSQRLTSAAARIRPTPTTLQEFIPTIQPFQDEIYKEMEPQQHKELDFGPEIEPGEGTPNLRDISNERPSDRLLRWHYRLGHLPFKVIQNMAKQGLIEPKLAKIEPPLCPGCLYGKQTKRNWRHKPSKKLRRKGLKAAKRPGHTVSVDTMPSTSVPGLMPQLRGRPTTRRYKYATVFIDHYSDFTYAHLHESNTAEEVLAGKLAFERHSFSSGVKIRHYHCDNGVFADKDFITSCNNMQQTYSFCGVNAHHQNGVAERRIRDLRESARSMLLLAKHNWPTAISTHLWPFAIKYACTIRNAAAREGAQSPIEKFTSTAITPNLKDFHTFGCPVYILDNKLQAGQTQQHKWMDRSKIGIYLGTSPHHSHNVALVLNTITGLTSPQFHVKFDDRFETVKTNPLMSETHAWQEKTQIIKQEKLQSTKRNTRDRDKSREGSKRESKSDKRTDTGNRTGDPRTRQVGVGHDSNTSHNRRMTNRTGNESIAPHPRVRHDSRIQRNSNNNKHNDSIANRTRNKTRGQARLHALYLQTYKLSIMKKMHTEMLLSEFEEIHPFSFAASLSDEDTMYLHQALKEPDKDNLKRRLKHILQMNIGSYTPDQKFQKIKRC